MKLRDSSVSQIHMLLRDLPVKPTELTDLQVYVIVRSYFCYCSFCHIAFQLFESGTINEESGHEWFISLLFLIF